MIIKIENKIYLLDINSVGKKILNSNKVKIISLFIFITLTSIDVLNFLNLGHQNKIMSEILFKNGYDIRHTWYVNNFHFRKLNNKKNIYKNSELLQNFILTLPTNDYFSNYDIQKICYLINTVIS